MITHLERTETLTECCSCLWIGMSSDLDYIGEDLEWTLTKRCPCCGGQNTHPVPIRHEDQYN